MLDFVVFGVLFAFAAFSAALAFGIITSPGPK